MAGRKGRSGGRNKKARHLHVVDGTFRPARHGDRTEARPRDGAGKPSGIPSPPAWLPPVARAEWRRVVPLLVERKLLERLDRATFACYCLAWQELYDAQCLIKHELAQCEALVKLDVPTHLEGLDRDRFIEAQKKAAKVIAGRGCTGYNRFGEEVRSAAAQITAAAEKRVREFSIEFGLTTRSRGLATTGGGTDDADDAPEFPLELHDAPAHTPGA